MKVPEGCNSVAIYGAWRTKEGDFVTLYFDYDIDNKALMEIGRINIRVGISPLHDALQPFFRLFDRLPDPFYITPEEFETLTEGVELTPDEHADYERTKRHAAEAKAEGT